MEPLPAEPYRATIEPPAGPPAGASESWPPAVYVPGREAEAPSEVPDRAEVVRVVEEALVGTEEEEPEPADAGAGAGTEEDAPSGGGGTATEREAAESPAREAGEPASPETLSELLRRRLATDEATGALDVSAVLGSPELIEEVAEVLGAEAAERDAEVVLALESRGFLLGIPVARSLRLPFVAVWREGRCPGEPLTVRRQTAEGPIRLEILSDGLAPGRSVFIVDATVSSGETLAAAAELAELAEGTVVGIGVLAARAGGGYEETLKGYDVVSLVEL